MNQNKWILLLAVLLLSFLNLTIAQENNERFGLRLDAPGYGKRGLHWVGYKSLTVGEGAEQLELKLWYPALNPSGSAEDISYKIRLKSSQLGSDNPAIVYGHALLDAPLDEAMSPYPLVVFSHGFLLNPEWYNTLVEHYASHGFIVIAPEHGEQDWNEVPLASIDRPKDITQTLDFAEQLTAAGGDLAGQIDMANIAVVGHSYGGYTALAMAGAQFDLDPFYTHCSELSEDDPKNFLCMPFMGQEAEMAARAGLDATSEGLWPSFGDARVTAIIPIAGDAFLFNEAGLANITIPMMAMGGMADTGTPWEWGSKPSFDHVSSTRKALVGFEQAEHMFVATSCENMPWTAGSPLFGLFCLEPVWDKERALDLAHHFSTAFLLAELKADNEAAAALAPDSVNFLGIDYEAVGFSEAKD